MYLTLLTLLLLTFNHKITANLDESEISFYLFTSPKYYTVITKDYAPVDPNSSVVFLIHGWTETRKKEWYSRLTNAFLARPKKTSVIQVDWAEPAADGYIFAAFNTITVGEIIGDFVLTLIENHNVPPSNIHICGHSLGGHVAGTVGKYTQQMGFKLGRITALDPAGPYFEGMLRSTEFRLTEEDAEIVVVLHTDTLKSGFLESSGTVDIYPNGYVLFQPGCPEGLMGTCSHHRSWQFFIDALEHPGTFVVTRCSNYLEYTMGECEGGRHLDLGGEFGREDEGNYYITTGDEPPYGMIEEENKNFRKCNLFL